MEEIDTAKKSVDWYDLSSRLFGHSDNANANNLNMFQLERNGNMSSQGELFKKKSIDF